MDIAVNKSIFIAPPSLLSRNISLYALVDTYDKWRGGSDVLTTQLVIDEGSMTIAAVKALILAKLQQNYIEAAYVIVEELATQIADGNLGVVTISIQYNWNSYCSILRKERGRAGASYTTESVYWTANPWDYTGTVETACRVLTERY